MFGDTSVYFICVLPLENVLSLSFSDELDVEQWTHGQYYDIDDPLCPSTVIPLHFAQCQLARGVVPLNTDPKMWITTPMDRVCAPMAAEYNLTLY